MKRWAIQKILPLYIKDKDFPILRSYIGKQIEECSVCKKEFETYDGLQKSLSSLKESSLPPKVLDNYWEDLQRKIQLEKNQTAPKTSFIDVGIFSNWLSRGAVIAAFCLMMYVYIANPFTQEQSINVNQANVPSWKASIKDFISRPFQSGSLYSRKALEYKMDQARPCNSSEISF